MCSQQNPQATYSMNTWTIIWNVLSEHLVIVKSELQNKAESGCLRAKGSGTLKITSLCFMYVRAMFHSLEINLRGWFRALCALIRLAMGHFNHDPSSCHCPSYCPFSCPYDWNNQSSSYSGCRTTTAQVLIYVYTGGATGAQILHDSYFHKAAKHQRLRTLDS